MHHGLMSPCKIAFALHPFPLTTPLKHVLQCQFVLWNTICQHLVLTIPNHLLCQMASYMPFEPQHPTILHSWVCSCSTMIKGDFVPKGTEQFDCSSQDPNFEYKKYLVLFIWEQLVLVVLVENKKRSDRGKSRRNPRSSYKNWRKCYKSWASFWKS